MKKKKYVIVRTFSAGVFAGELESQKGDIVTLVNARRLWLWAGAASLSELAVHGVGKPLQCKFPCEVPRVQLTRIELIDTTKKAELSIKAVPVWTAQQ